MKRSRIPTFRAGTGLWMALQLGACVLKSGDLGELAEGSSGDDDTASGSEDGISSTSAGSTTTTTTGDSGDEPIDCDAPQQGPISCAEDLDQDSVRVACDSDPAHFNPSQADGDGDGIADVADRCPTIASDATPFDADGDGIGDECDMCPYSTAYYRALAADAQLDATLVVRNVPDLGDADGDGVGDACDNCITVANCGDFDATDPWALGEPIDRMAASCQRDDDQDGIGDACSGLQAAGAAGPVGFGALDDFDQDGLANGTDGCPRLPVTRIACSDDGPCPTGSTCDVVAGVCSHVDIDQDLVGDACDTCSAAANGTQVVDGGEQEDDPDGDFTGSACEAGEGCDVRADPRPLAAYPVAVEGQCCAVLLVEDDNGDLFRNNGSQVVDVNGLPVRLDCVVGDPELATCARLPDAVAAMPGVLTPPPGCVEALGSVEAVVAQRPSTEGDPAVLWTQTCMLPPFDEDFDGLGDACDLCPWTFDPTNEIYVDDSGMVWPNDGKYCNGVYDGTQRCDFDE